MKTMKLLFALSISILLFFNPVFSIFAEGKAEAAAFEQAVEQYRSGELEAAAESFRRAASSAETDYAAAAYYNYGTIQAGLAENTDEVQKKRELLESSYDALKRSADIGTLPAEQERFARQNMQIVRERLSQLPDEQKREPQDGGGQEDEQQSGQNGQQNGQQQAQDGQQQSGQNGQDNGADGDPLQQQRELREQTESGRGSEQELAQQQKKLQQKSEDAGQNEAALNQQKAAEALRQGDRQRAAEYQKAAEKELESAAAEERDSEAEQIMDREAEQQAQRNRLDKSGGINEADKNW